jgi:iron complex outermembrane receptor protein
MTLIFSARRQAKSCATLFFTCLLCGLPATTLLSAETDSPAITSAIESLVVTATRVPTAELDTVGNITALSADQIQLANAVHPYELAVQVPGTWISRGNGQEHLTAIRSPVLTGAGSCGAFLIMEDGIATRPAGFCNVNQLFEIPTAMAHSLEVIRGPANALYGSNGLHGTINTLLPTPGLDPLTGVSIETGSNDYWRGQFGWDSGPASSAWNAGLILDRDGGYRDDSGYEQAKLFIKNLRETNNGQLSFGLSGSWLEQETAGFITGYEAYKETDRFRNENPEAYRDAYSLRLSAGWTPDPGSVWAPEYKVYMRHSDMDFLMHFLPGKPREQNNQTSIGALAVTRRDIGNASRLTLGFDTEYANGSLDQFQENPANFGTSRPVGQQYDYAASSYVLAAHASLEMPLSDRWELQAGLRGEFIYYDYDNKMLAGNTTDAGSSCPPVSDPPADPFAAGCLYSRPADRSDSFFNLAPNIGALYRLANDTVWFTNFASGFRVPQATELYRLQRDQQSADIDSERLNSIETGIRHIADKLSVETVIYYMRKSNFIFRDAASENVSNGKTKHYGIEANLNWQIADPVYISVVGSYAKQTYDFNSDAGLGETIVKGNEIDTAPQVLASARLGYDHNIGLAELEWAYNDAYFLDAANTARYDGHSLLNLRLETSPVDNWSIALRVMNLTDVKYADRADYLTVTAPANRYRYFPGREREVYLQLSWKK